MAFLGSIATIASIAGSLVGAVGGIVSGIAAKRAGDYQNQVAQMNAQIARTNASRAQERSQIEAQQNDRATLGLLGEQEAAQAASGFLLQSKSNVLTRRAARRLGRQDTLAIRNAGDVEAYGYLTGAVNAEAEGRLAKMQGKAGMLQGFLGAAQSLIGGAASVANAQRYTAGGLATSAAKTSSDPWTGLRRKTDYYPRINPRRALV